MPTVLQQWSISSKTGLLLTHATDADVRFVASHFPHLTKLSLEGCDSISDVSLAELARWAPSRPSSRPNSMNKYGLVLNEIGLEPLFDSLLRRVLQAHTR